MSIFDAIDFYPTPEDVVKKMIQPYLSDLRNKRILEPSAGSGNIIDTIRNLNRGNHNIDIACVEINPELRSILYGKNCRVIADDFLTFQPEEFFNLILMNPPFSSGVDHLLHAWAILEQGDIACLLNAETLKNPYSAKREVLSKLITDHGSVEYLNACFSHAERSTDVEVALVRLQKIPERGGYDFLENGMNESEGKTEGAFSAVDVNGLVNLNQIKTMVDVYNGVRDLIGRFIQESQHISYLVSQLLYSWDFHADEFIKLAVPFCSFDSTADQRVAQYKDSYNAVVKFLRKEAWERVFEQSSISGYLTRGVRTDFEKFQSSASGMQFTERNIRTFFENVMLNRDKILKDAVLEAFDLMTRYHKDNRVHVEGWKTNDSWKVNRRVVLPNLVKLNDFNGKFEFNIWKVRDNELDDIDKGLCFITGKNYKHILTSIHAMKQAFENYKSDAVSEFFDIKFYKKGTIHLFFRDEKVWERFNLTVARLRNWIPDQEAH